MTMEKAKAIADVLEEGYIKTGSEKIILHVEVVQDIMEGSGFIDEAKVLDSVKMLDSDDAEEKGQGSNSGQTEKEGDRMSAYYDVLSGLVEEHGLSDANPMAYSGVAYADLMDIDSDGQKELFVMYGKKTNPSEEYAYDLLYEVYGYKDGSAYRLAQENACDSMDLHFSVGICSDDENICFRTYNSGLADGTIYVGTKRNDEWETREFYNYDPEFDGGENGNRKIYKIDGKEVSEQEYWDEYARLDMTGENAGREIEPSPAKVKELLEKLKNGGNEPESQTNEMESLLTDYYWESMVQSYQVYEFKEDGTGNCYEMEPEAFYDKSLIATGIEHSSYAEYFTYEIDGNGKLKIRFSDSGWETNLEYVKKNDDISWDMGIYDNLPTDGKFFYETSFTDDGMSNAMYFANTGIKR